MWKSSKRQDLQGKGFLFISGGEKAVMMLKSIGITAVVNYCFYRMWTAFFLLLPLGFGYYQKQKKERMHRKQEELRQQFKELLYLTVAGQKAGYSVENAFLKSYEDMAGLYGEESGICRILRYLQSGLSNHVPASDLWKSIGEISGIAEIKEFAEVFVIAKGSGGNMTAVMERTAGAIGSRAETQKEIETLLSAGKLEQKIMNAMPFLLILYIEVTSPGYFNGLYHSIHGIAVMTSCLLVYLSAYIWGMKLVSVEIR